MSLDTSKKIGLIACTGVVAGNMMGSGIALLPSGSLCGFCSFQSCCLLLGIVALVSHDLSPAAPHLPLPCPRHSLHSRLFGFTPRTQLVTSAHGWRRDKLSVSTHFSLLTGYRRCALPLSLDCDEPSEGESRR